MCNQIQQAEHYQSLREKMDKIQKETQTEWNFQSEKCEIKSRKINSIT